MKRILTAEQKQQFINDGYTIVHGLFSEELICNTRKVLFDDLGAAEDDPATWPSKAELGKWIWGAGKYTHELRSSKVEQVVTELAGPHLHTLSFHTGKESVGLPACEEGFIPVLTFPTPLELRPPGPKRFVEPQGWHFDGIAGTAILPEVLMMVVFVYLNDVRETGGATTVKPGSHRQVFKKWMRSGEMSPLADMIDDFAPSRPLPGKAGDAIFFHYLLVHSGSDNFDDQIRVGLNTCVHQDPNQPYRVRVGMPDASWTPFDFTLRTDNIVVSEQLLQPEKVLLTT